MQRNLHFLTFHSLFNPLQSGFSADTALMKSPVLTNTGHLSNCQIQWQLSGPQISLRHLTLLTNTAPFATLCSERHCHFPSSSSLTLRHLAAQPLCLFLRVQLLIHFPSPTSYHFLGKYHLRSLHQLLPPAMSLTRTLDILVQTQLLTIFLKSWNFRI